MTERAPPAPLSEAERARHDARSRELEVACDFRGAAEEAVLALDPRRGLLLAALAGDEALVERATTDIVDRLAREDGVRAASEMLARGFPLVAGPLFEALGEHASAAEAFVAGRDVVHAASAFERAGRPVDGARALEAALRARPQDQAARLALGRLLLRHGRTEVAVRALQQLEPGTPERASALPLLKRALAELGLEDASRTLAEEMTKLGVDDVAPDESALELPRGLETGGVLLFGRYQVAREIAHTQHARVVEAVDRVTSEHVAVKLFANQGGESGRDAILRFEREAQALAQLRHPNVVPLRAYVPEGPAIVVAWMSGGTLADRLRGEPIAPARAVEIAEAVLAALGEAHRMGILHRDVKPSNVLFDGAGAARLGDFGAAHLGDLSTTATAGAIGTFAYMSPEQRLGRPATLASDLYAVGALLGELLTGTAPGPAIAGRVEPPPSSAHPDLTPAHDAILARFLDDDPSRRPADAFEARKLLGSIAWPVRVMPRARPASERPAPAQEAALRLGPPLGAGDGRDLDRRKRDAWLDRDVLVFAIDEPSLTLARAFARAGHPSLPTVLRLDLDGGAFWIAVPRGASLADEPRGLAPGQLARLREAVRSLHDAGGAHGAIDAEHLYVHDGDVLLAFPRRATSGDEAADLAALERLEHGV